MSTSVAGLSSNFFPDAENGFTTTTAGSVASGAATVTLNSVAGYTNGLPVVLVIDPTDSTKKQTFTGIVDTSGVQITSVVWTAGTNQTHVLGATVVDYATATHIAMISKGIAVHADQDGTLKAGAVDVATVIASGIITDTQMSTEVKPVTRAIDTFFDFVASGCVWSGDAYASTRNASMTAGVVYIDGVRIAVSAVTARSFTASNDVYVDVGTDGVINYTDTTTNAASPALAASHIRLGIVVVGASSIAAAASVNQGQADRVLPIASSIAYTGTDSLGNLICPRDPSRKILGYSKITSNVTTTTTPGIVDITGLSTTVNVPADRSVRIVLSTPSETATGAAIDGSFYIRESSTTLNSDQINLNGGSRRASTVSYKGSPSAGVHTYKASFSQSAAGTLTVYGSATQFPSLTVELV